MSCYEDFKARWEPHFGSEPWWEMQCQLYEGPGHDWEGADVAIDQLVYAMAKARGLDTSQTCPRCAQVVDTATCLGEHTCCETCDAEDERRHQADLARQAKARLRHEIWYRGLTPEQRARYDHETKVFVQHTLGGLWKRDVQ